jgi:hypothetical protein
MGIRVGSVKDGKVTAYIPPPPVSDPKLQPPEGITVDSHGAIYAPRSNRATSRRRPVRSWQGHDAKIELAASRIGRVSRNSCAAELQI